MRDSYTGLTEVEISKWAGLCEFRQIRRSALYFPMLIMGKCQSFSLHLHASVWRADHPSSVGHYTRNIRNLLQCLWL